MPFQLGCPGVVGPGEGTDRCRAMLGELKLKRIQGVTGDGSEVEIYLNGALFELSGPKGSLRSVRITPNYLAHGG